MKPSEILKKIYNNGKRIFSDKEQREIIKFKKGIWQTDEVSNSFIKGTDSSTMIAADMMDREVNEFFLANCSLEERVLDIGCGHGIVSEYLAKNGIHVSAVDISEKLLDSFRSRIENKNLPIEIKQGDAYKIPFDKNTFDVVVARMFLPHFPDWPVVLKEMARVTKPGGKLLVHFSSSENTSLGKKLGKLHCEFASSPVPLNGWTFYAETDDKKLDKICSSIGLEVKERVPVSFFLHNRILGYSLGTSGNNQYLEKAQKFFENDKVREFAVWFDKEIISKCSPALSHFNIIHFKKIN